MYDTIVIPTDGSEQSARAAEHGLYLARAFDATVHVINVIDVQHAAGVFNVGGVGEEFIARLEREGEEAIGTVEAVIGGTDAIRTAVPRGKPTEAILEYAADHDADLLVMGAHGRTGLNRYIAGSVTERVVRLANIPVLAVRTPERNGNPNGIDYEEVLVPTDGSEPAAAAVDHGLAIAGQTGARIHAVNVINVGEITIDTDYTLPSEVTQRLRSEGEAAIEVIAAQARDDGLDVVMDVCEGSPAKALIGYANENDVDLIAMGTAGRTGFDRYLLGSTTEHVIRRAEMPVLAVNARGRANADSV